MPIEQKVWSCKPIYWLDPAHSAHHLHQGILNSSAGFARQMQSDISKQEQLLLALRA